MKTHCETVITQPEECSTPITTSGGRTKNFTNKRHQITSDKTILSVALGYELELYGMESIQMGKIKIQSGQTTNYSSYITAQIGSADDQSDSRILI